MIKLSKDTIDKMFNTNETSDKIIMDLFAIAVPDFHRKKVKRGFPEISDKTNSYLFEKFIALDKKKKPNQIQSRGAYGLTTDSAPTAT